ncbi:MAG: ABC transporter ATP-binding protein, partial [Bacteroidales bacterium]|nr:ABC transporter ATP-binding protein [Bacteroidales bacterium]
MPTAIEFNNISKLYRLGTVSTGTLSHDIKRWWTMNIRRQPDPYMKIGETNDLRVSRVQDRVNSSDAEARRSGRSQRSAKGESDYVWALRDIDFKVEQGDVVGIIGKNGAGKSTLLKILSKVTAPTTGTIRARGRIGSLLEVGTGFHPEMTGRENIYLNGAILGMTKTEISKKLDEIVDFSGCERYIDTPVKRYSSGMMVRLGFAVAAHLDPEILVVDEVLAVGDAEFQ